MNTKLTRRITFLLFGAVAATIFTISAVIVWMAGEFNEKSANDSQVMIQGGLEAIHDTLKLVTVDYSWWQDAYDNIKADNVEWLISNIGSGVIDSSALDLAVVAPPTGPAKYGWLKTQETNEPQTGLLTQEQIDRMRDLIRDTPSDEVVARTQFDMVGDQVVLLASAHITSDDPSGLDFDTLSTNIFGFIFDEERISELGESFLTDDLKLSSVIEPDKQHIALRGVDDEILGYLVWTAPAPGAELLSKTLLPLSAALISFALIGFLVAYGANKFAEELGRKEAESYESARTDSMTQLPNRFHFVEALGRRSTRMANEKGEMAVIFLDIDGFKNVNDTIGHAGGDDLICQIAQRLETVLPEQVFLARVGGDEFNLLLCGREIASQVRTVAQECINEIQKDFRVKGRIFRMSVSVGYAISEGGHTSCEEVVRRADVAMYLAKSRNPGEPVAYDKEYESNLFKNKQIDDALRAAMNAGDVMVRYQPIVNAGTGKMEMAEALIHWDPKHLGPMSPAQYIPIAEESGLIVPLGLYVFQRVCEDLAEHPDLKVSVNLSPIQLLDPLLTDNLLTIVESTGVDTSRIELELTEGIVVSHPGLAREKLETLAAAGFGIVLDDFGTGFSSIGYLRQFPFNKLKIDRSFISGVETDVESLNLMKSIASLGRALDLTVVAEGVETSEQANLTHLAGCNQIQGFYFSRPVLIDALVKWEHYCDGIANKSKKSLRRA
jgi:diguanylate cyclase (GGDEF)-like protein